MSALDLQEPPLVPKDATDASISERITAIVVKQKIGPGWLASLAGSFALLMLFNFCVGYLFVKGVGIWGIEMPVAWGFAIVNFVWWVGIGHAGTFISAVLYLCNQEWRTSINRFTEAMTLFAVSCAGLFPLLHLGRPWVFYYLFPYPNTMGLWPQFRSPLMWDMFAVLTYATVSIVFWFIGMLPDLATLRDRSPQAWQRVLYGILALGWRGSTRQWSRYGSAYLIMAGLATPLVVSVHSIVSLDFAVGIVPGWHTTILPYYFVAGAIESGFCMVLTLIIPLRHFYQLKDLITIRHLDNMGKILLATSLIVGHGYITEIFMSWYAGDPFEKQMMMDRFTGQYAPTYWFLVFADVGIVQALWFKTVRRSVPALFCIAILANVGMYLDHYILVIQSLHHDYMPSDWRFFHGTFWDWATLFGSFGLFLTLLFLFIRTFPMISMFEVRKAVHKKSQVEETP
jgi:Ni/Fe-hydrogenase subunit HybB-like protein